MRLKRFYLLVLCFTLCFSMSSAAFPVASGGNLRKTVPQLRSSVGTVTNTLYRGSVKVRAYDSSNALIGQSDMQASNGSFAITNMERDMSYFVIAIPKSALPSSGTYTVSMDLANDFSMDISNVRYRWFKTISSATSATGFINCTLLRYNTGGDFYDGGTVIDLSSNYSELRVHVNISNSGQRNIGGTFRMNLSLNQVDQGVVAGTPYNSEDNSNTMVQQNEQIIAEQQETNGILERIIQHISDQLYALWNQIFNIMAVPWKTEQHNDSVDTQDKIEEESGLIQSAISSLGNFLINGLKDLFIPDDEYFENYADELKTFFEGRLGVLEYPLTFIIGILNDIYDFALTGDENLGNIYFPGISFSQMPILENGTLTSKSFVIAQPQVIRLSDNRVVNTLLSYVRFSTSAGLVLALIYQIRKKLEGVLNN